MPIMPSKKLTLLAAVTWLAAHGPLQAAEVDIAALAPGCLEPWQRVLLLASTLSEPVARQGGQVSIVASGPDGLAAPGMVVFPVAAAADASPAPITRIPEQLGEDIDVDVLETPFERIVVDQPLDDVDLLAMLEQVARASGGRFPDIVRRRLVMRRGPGSLVLDTGDSAVQELAEGGTRREVVARFDVQLGGRRGSLVAISRSLGGPMRVHRALHERPTHLVVHAGGVRGESCGRALLGLGVTAVVPRTVDLAMPVNGMPYLAANLVDPNGQSVHPRFSIVQVHGARVALVGLVGSGELARAPVEVRARLHVRSGRDALADVVAELRRAEPGPPDVVVVLSSGDGAERAQLAAVDGVDVVIADFSRDDGLPLSMELAPGAARERSRHDALVSPVFHRAGLGRVSLSLVEGEGMLRLRAIRVEVDPLLDDGAYHPSSAAFAAPLRREEDARAASGSAVVLPPVRALAGHQDARPLVWGESIAILGEKRRRAPGDPPLWTDELWLRVIGNQVLDASDSDVSLLRNMRRVPLVAGPLSRGTATGWMVDTDDVAVMELTGVQLTRLAERLAALPPTLDDASGLIATAGLDPTRKLVAGRVIEPLAGYRVAVDSRLLGDPRLGDVLEPGRVRAALPLVSLAADRLSAARGLDLLVGDRAQRRTAEWRLGLQTLELRGSAVRTSPGLRALAPSLETRALQRDLLLASARLHAFALWDDDGFAWDNQVRVQYDATFFTDGGPGPPVVEPFDDVLIVTELRVHALQLKRSRDVVTLSPFMNISADGELTPAPALRRQAQLRESAGLALTTGGALREVRVGAVVQQVASGVVDTAMGDGKIYTDAGLLGLIRLAAPLMGPVSVESVSDARFFFADNDDRPFDLALRAQSVTRLTAPLSASTSGFLFVDVVALSPKPAPMTIEWNIVAGAGLAFGQVLRF